MSTPERRPLIGAPGNLPVALSSFIGRDGEVERVGELLTHTRSLTLTGAGGCGKTRLAREAAGLVAARFPDGVWWVELAALGDGALVADALARAMELPLEGRPALEVITEHVADTVVLVVLDNCEHLVEDVAVLVDGLLRATGALRVLATSRQPLGVDGETTWRVPSMAVPPLGCERDRLGDFDASRLFLERLGRARPDAAEVPDETASVVQLCRRLDGIPLALELAAARARTMRLSRIVGELDDRFRLLNGGPRTAIARQRTLQASVQWSHDLLDDDERVLLRRTAVFAGGFRSDAAQVVAGFPPLSPGDVLEVLARLVDRSMIGFDAARDRYGLLETIREYSAERVEAAGETDEVAARHLDWMCTFVDRHDEAMTRADPDALDVVEEELPDIRTALDHAAHGPDAQVGLRLVVGLTFFWAQRGLGLEGAQRAGRVLTAHPAADGVLRARGWAAAAYDAFYGGDFAAAAEYADRGLAEATAAGDLRAQARCRHVQGISALLVDPAQARRALAETIELARSGGDQWCETDALQLVGFSYLVQHRHTSAHDPLTTSAAMARAQGNAFQLAWHQLGLYMIAAAEGRLADAALAARRGANDGQRIGDPAIELWGRAGQLTTALARGRYADIDPIADEAASPGRPVSPVIEAFVTVLRRVARLTQDPTDALEGLAELAELLRTTFVPNEGLRLGLLTAAGWLALGDHERAETAADAALEHATALGSALAGPTRVLLARLRRQRGDPLAAERLAHDGLAEIQDAGLISDLPDALETVAGTSLDLGAPTTAVRLLGAAATLRSTLELPISFPVLADADEAAARDALGEDFTVRWDEGRRMDKRAAVTFARRSRGERKRPSTGWAALTPTELDVARLAAEGLTNLAIGEQLFIARGTVKTHLEHIYAKLTLHSRAQLATALARRTER